MSGFTFQKMGRITPAIVVLGLLLWPSLAAAQDGPECPETPAGFSVNYGNNSTELTFEWDNDTGCTVMLYELQVGRTPGSSDLGILRLPGTTRSFRIFPPRGLQFYARLLAYSQTDVSEPTSPDLFVTSGNDCGVPNPPTDVSTAPHAGFPSNIDILFRAPAAGCPPVAFAIAVGTAQAAQNVFYGEGIPTERLINPTTGVVTLVMTTPALPDGAYFVRVYSLTRTGRSAPSTEVSFFVPGFVFPTLPPTPLNFRATVTGRTLTVAWDVPPAGLFGGGVDAPGHRLLASTTPNDPNAQKIDLGGARSPAQLTPAPGIGGVFYLRLVGYIDPNGPESLPSNEVRVFVPFQ